MNVLTDRKYQKTIQIICFNLVPDFQGYRKEFKIDNNNDNYVTRRYGNTTFRIRVHLSENATETFEEKMLRLVRNDSSKSWKKERNDNETQENR